MSLQALGTLPSSSASCSSDSFLLVLCVCAVIFVSPVVCVLVNTIYPGDRGWLRLPHQALCSMAGSCHCRRITNSDQYLSYYSDPNGNIYRWALPRPRLIRQIAPELRLELTRNEQAHSTPHRDPACCKCSVL